MPFEAAGRSWPSRKHFERDVIELATRHALSVHEDRDTAPLTPYGIASCAAATALVLTDAEHPNHRLVWERQPRARFELGPLGSTA